ncbi:UPF0280 family protein [Gemmobacter denitrificans]|uniref:UPF0280 family protein n=1 Tax=Gemmobacter denitrificans TaxID=3123040 RepID=A0ABU8BYJ7_9RHOB
MTHQAHLLPDGRLHLHHGPMDVIVSAEGADVPVAYRAAEARFATILTELVAELPALRSAHPGLLTGAVARRMAAAVAPHRPAFITPMAAVAGAVAQEVLAAMPLQHLRRAAVNNGGDIALHLAPGASYRIALAGCGITAQVVADSGVRGIATSGRGGRSLSFGIADAVTVLAATAAGADAAATMIANAVDLPGHPAILRQPACDVQADSDLGARPVTRAVGHLTAEDMQQALQPGAALAQQLIDAGVIAAAAVFLHPFHIILGQPLLAATPEPACA